VVLDAQASTSAVAGALRFGALRVGFFLDVR